MGIQASNFAPHRAPPSSVDSSGSKSAPITVKTSELPFEDAKKGIKIERLGDGSISGTNLRSVANTTPAGSNGPQTWTVVANDGSEYLVVDDESTVDAPPMTTPPY